MHLYVASNFDDELLRSAMDYPVNFFFGKLPADFIGGGRASFTQPPILKKRFEAHVSTARKLGFKFNYLPNGVCYDNRELTIKGQKQIHQTLKWIFRGGLETRMSVQRL